jgi:hypothetical protein
LRIARLLLRTSAHPRLALERDDALYDVELLEKELGSAVEIPGDPWDFHGRVVALACAGLPELDRAVLAGKRPSSARIVGPGFAWLPPFDGERSTYLRFDPRTDLVSPGHAASVTGQDALVDLPGDDDTTVGIEGFVGVLVGDDLRNATLLEARHSLIGVTIAAEWWSADRPTERLRTQAGPVLVPGRELRKLDEVALRIQAAGVEVATRNLGELGTSLDTAIARVSTHVPLRAGDMIALGPICAIDRVPFHQKVTLRVDRMGSLRGAAVPRR